ncbi:MAG: S41 family peptidase, partial [Cyanobacteria bacterium J06623_7]
KTYQAAEAQAKKLNTNADELMDRLLSTAWHEQIAQKILKDKRKGGGNGIIQYGVTSDNIGYLSILSMSNHGDNFNADNIYDAMDTIDLVMEDAMKELADTKAVIVDVSLNDGGSDAIARKFATYFTDHRTFVYSKEAGDAKNRPRHDLYIEPNDGGRYLKPVYMLTSDLTASAAEIFVMSMRALPNVTHVGETTTGSLSDTLSKTLPNGWWVSLSNEIYLDSQNTLWESKGIPPEINIPVFDPNDIFQGHYEAVTQVLQLIQGDRQN